MPSESRPDAFSSPPHRPHDSLWVPPQTLANPRPPFQIGGVRMIYVEGLLPRGGALPGGLALSDGRFAAIGLYTAASGWGITPYSGAYARASLAGVVSPDGSEAFLHLTGTLSHRAAKVLPALYHAGWSAADHRLDLAETAVEADCPLGQGCRLRIRARLTGAEPVNTAGTHRELGLDSSGRLREWLSSYACRVRGLQVTDLGLTAPPGHILAGFTFGTAYLLDEKSFSLGEPQPFPMPDPDLAHLGLTPAEARIALRLGRGDTAPAVAAELGISPHTVRSTLKTIYGKLGVNNRAALGAWIERLTRT